MACGLDTCSVFVMTDVCIYEPCDVRVKKITCGPDMSPMSVITRVRICVLYDIPVKTVQ